MQQFSKAVAKQTCDALSCESGRTLVAGRPTGRPDSQRTTSTRTMSMCSGFHVEHLCGQLPYLPYDGSCKDTVTT